MGFGGGGGGALPNHEHSLIPLDGGPQHTADYTDVFEKMLTNINVVSLEEPEDIFPAYEEALLGDDFHATLLIENGGFYNDK